MSGIFITFEGIEGCGKSTQANFLKQYFEKNQKNVFLTREPGGPKISEKIRAILLDKENAEMVPETELLLYMASRSQHTAEWIIPLLKSDTIVISDRYFDSTIAYQGAARSLDLNFIKSLTKFATYNTKPDVTFLIDLEPVIGLGRISSKDADRIEKESLLFHTKVRNGFLDVAKKEKKRYKIIDGTKSIEEIHEIILENVNKIIKERKN